jgi:hypothetical protein
MVPERDPITYKMQRIMWNQDNHDTSGVEELPTSRSGRLNPPHGLLLLRGLITCLGRRISVFRLLRTSTTELRSPTPEEIEAGIEIGKAIVCSRHWCYHADEVFSALVSTRFQVGVLQSRRRGASEGEEDGAGIVVNSSMS